MHIEIHSVLPSSLICMHSNPLIHSHLSHPHPLGHGSLFFHTYNLTYLPRYLVPSIGGNPDPHLTGGRLGYFRLLLACFGFCCCFCFDLASREGGNEGVKSPLRLISFFLHKQRPAIKTTTTRDKHKDEDKYHQEEVRSRYVLRDVGTSWASNIPDGS